MPKVTICVLLYGDYPKLARRNLESIRRDCPRSEYRLIVGANAIGNDTLTYVKSLEADGDLDHLILSRVNLSKCPMMRQMFAQVETEFIWWFDDDSHIVEPTAFVHWIKPALAAPHSTVIWGQLACCDHEMYFANDVQDAVSFVRGARWYCRLSPPSWRPGGKGEFDLEGKGTGDGRWFFILGGCWLARTTAMRTLDWPDPRLTRYGDDVFLGEAIRQHGWTMSNLGIPGVAMNTEPRRGEPGIYTSSGPMLTMNPPLF